MGPLSALDIKTPDHIILFLYAAFVISKNSHLSTSFLIFHPSGKRLESKPEENIKARYFGMHLSKGPLLKLSPRGGPSQTKETAAGGL